MQPDKYLPRIQFEEKFCMACFWDGQDPETSYITHFLKVRSRFAEQMHTRLVPSAWHACVCFCITKPCERVFTSS